MSEDTGSTSTGSRSIEHLNEIYEKAGSKFKVQMGVGRILRNVENNELKYWRAEHDQHHVLLKDSENQTLCHKPR